MAITSNVRLSYRPSVMRRMMGQGPRGGQALGRESFMVAPEKAAELVGLMADQPAPVSPAVNLALERIARKCGMSVERVAIYIQILAGCDGDVELADQALNYCLGEAQQARLENGDAEYKPREDEIRDEFVDQAFIRWGMTACDLSDETQVAAGRPLGPNTFVTSIVDPYSDAIILELALWTSTESEERVMVDLFILGKERGQASLEHFRDSFGSLFSSMSDNLGAFPQVMLSQTTAVPGREKETIGIGYPLYECIWGSAIPDGLLNLRGDSLPLTEISSIIPVFVPQTLEKYPPNHSTTLHVLLSV